MGGIPDKLPQVCYTSESTTILMLHSAMRLVSTLVSTYSWLVNTLHSVPSSNMLCQPVLTVVDRSSSGKKYRFVYPSRCLLSTLDCTCMALFWVKCEILNFCNSVLYPYCSHSSHWIPSAPPSPHTHTSLNH